MIEKASQHNIMSAINSGLMVPTIRYLSFKGLYSPAESQTKEIKTDIIFSK